MGERWEQGKGPAPEGGRKRGGRLGVISGLGYGARREGLSLSPRGLALYSCAESSKSLGLNLGLETGARPSPARARGRKLP